MTHQGNRFEEHFILTSVAEKERFEADVARLVGEFNSESEASAEYKIEEDPKIDRLEGGDVALALIVLFATPVVSDVYAMFKRKVADFLRSNYRVRR